MRPDNDLCDWLLLQSLEGLGARTYLKLIEHFGSPRAAMQATPDQLLALPRFPRKLAGQMPMLAGRREQVEQLLCTLQDQGVHFTTLWHEDYPDMLRQLPDPPPVISLCGKFSGQDVRAVAIVGSREASARGLEIAAGFGRRLAAAGVTVVSGYAKGIDTAGHLGALQGGGRTIMILSHGINHFRLREAGFESVDYLKKHGVILSEYFPTMTWTAGAAMARNRLIVGLARAVLVVECGVKSGTMDTAERTRKAGKPLFVVAFQKPDEYAAGNVALLEQGAVPVRTFTDMQTILQVLPPAATS
ncbi:MAG: DNA-protecting protein DprA [candidate division KSB1 bacterium]|nr:DNA-protecting protein DprA [candidate division KSB1 bacterium]MDZ7275578.1 DNA-protecting protein DprA [candidate division KSB1 bacterium]MDZ7284731.1 DNA-protecting protein DprA [candidate division KSB1 bacterium]MDZ7297850.1 DNA-protecting protein DprA [candidate division KSB1 bacterium]MDZ7308758.1 DNA-protecting protein DprA [candidate division KSB1 bacterium]